MPATLTPEEIKALMSAIQDGRVDTETARAPRAQAVPYDLTSQDRIIRGQMPTLDAINEQIASMLGIGLAGRTRVGVRVTSSPATLLKFADLVPLLAPPASVPRTGSRSRYSRRGSPRPCSRPRWATGAPAPPRSRPRLGAS